jgi:hypothetical protein
MTSEQPRRFSRRLTPFEIVVVVAIIAIPAGFVIVLLNGGLAPGNTITARASADLLHKQPASPSRQAAIDFANAIALGDMSRVHEVAVGSDAKFAWLQAFSNWSIAYQNYQVASAHQFGRDAQHYVEDSAKMVDQVQDADETIDGNTATLTYKIGDTQPIHILKTGGVWKVDLDSLWQDVDMAQSGTRVKLVAGVYNEMTGDVGAGKFKTAEEAQRELKTRIDNCLPPEYRLVNKSAATILATTAPSPGQAGGASH